MGLRWLNGRQVSDLDSVGRFFEEACIGVGSWSGGNLSVGVTYDGGLRMTEHNEFDIGWLPAEWGTDEELRVKNREDCPGYPDLNDDPVCKIPDAACNHCGETKGGPAGLFIRCLLKDDGGIDVLG